MDLRLGSRNGIIGVIPPQNITCSASTRRGCYIYEVDLPGDAAGEGAVNAFDGRPWAFSYDRNVEVLQDGIGMPQIGVTLGGDDGGNTSIRNLTTAVARAAAQISGTDRYAVQAEILLSLTQIPDEGDAAVVDMAYDMRLQTPYVTVSRAGDIVPPDMSIAAGIQFIRNELDRQLRERLARYKADQRGSLMLDRVYVRVQPGPRLGRGGDGSNPIARSIQSGSRVWIAFNPRTKSQCLFQCLCVGRSYDKPPKRTREGELKPYSFEDLFSHSRSAQAIWQNATSSFRDRLKTQCSRANHPWESDGYAGFATIQIFCDVYNIPVHLYSLALIKKRTFEPNPDSPLRLQRLPKLPRNAAPQIELIYTGEHYLVLLRRKSLDTVFGPTWVSEAENLRTKAIRFLDENAEGLRMYDAVAYGEANPLPAEMPQLEPHEPVGTLLGTPKYVIGDRYVKSFKQLALKYITWDTETYPQDGCCVLYATGAAWYELDGEELKRRCKIFKGEDSTREMLVWLGSGQDIPLEQINNSYLIAHNSAKFDVASLATSVALGNTPWELNCPTFVENNSRWITGKLIQKIPYTNANGTEKVKRITITLRDSYCLIPGALRKLARDLKVEVVKGDIPHDRIYGGAPKEKPDDLSTGPLHWEWLWEDGWDGRESTMGVGTYLRDDCLSLLEVCRVFGDGIYKKYKFDFMSCPTSASMSKRIFLQMFYDKQSMSVLADKLEAVVRSSFLGGRVECFRLGKINKPISYLDYTSLYPAVGRKDLPCGIPKLVRTADWRSEFGYFVVDVSCNMELVKDAANAHWLPMHPVIADSRLTFAWLKRKVRMCLFSESMVLAERLMPGCYEYDVKYALVYKRRKYMKGFFEAMVAEKSRARAAGEGALESAAKIVANAGTGPKRT